MIKERILFEPYISKIISASEAARRIQNKWVVGSSGFTKAGDSKAVLPAFAKRAEQEDVAITLITGASLGHTTDTDLANNDALIKRIPFQVDSALRNKINSGKILFIDQHLSETAEQINNGHLPHLNLAIIEAAYVNEQGDIIPTTSIGNSANFAHLADQIILEINTSIPKSIEGIHDVYIPSAYPHREIFNINTVDERIGGGTIKIDPKKVIGVVFNDITDSPVQETSADDNTAAIAKHLINFFEKEIAEGRLTPSLMPLQAGIGKVANAVLNGFQHGNFKDLVMYSEVLQDSTFELIDAGVMKYASASSVTLTQKWYDIFINNLDKYRDKVILRPQNISNAAEVIRRLGVIGINTAIEFDIYGNVNSTHISGTNMMNGIGGSGDFARNCYMSIFVAPSASKTDNAISHVVPMVSHVDHNEHDVDILVTENGLADLRGLAPRERAQRIIDHCVHPDYKPQLQDYFNRACERGGHTPHLLEEAFSWHINLKQNGSMKLK